MMNGNVIVRLRLAELLQKWDMKQADLARRTGLSPDRISPLATNRWQQLRRDELEILMLALNTTPSELFEVHRPILFHNAKYGGSIKIHLSPHWARAEEHVSVSEADVKPLVFTRQDVEAAQLVLDHAHHIGVGAALQLHNPLDRGGYQQLVSDGTHVAVGSNVSGGFSEYAIAYAHGAPAFDESCLDRFPFNFSWDERCKVKSSFGFRGAQRGIEEGIYSTLDRRVVARRTHTDAGNGEDCGLIVIVRKELPADVDRGVRRERFVVVLAGHGRNGTLACAAVLVNPEYQHLLYPEKANVAISLVVKATYHREQSPMIPRSNELCTLGRVEIVARASAEEMKPRKP